MDSTLKQLAIVLVGCSTVAIPLCAQQPNPVHHDVIMSKKLETAQNLFAAVTTGDFEGINRQAQKLSLLSQEAGWNRLQTPEYMRLSQDFRATTTQLQTAAGDKNLDAVALSFVKLSITCIDCHRHTAKELKGSAFTEVSFRQNESPEAVD